MRDHFSGTDFKKKIRITACIGPGTQKNQETTKMESKDAAKGIPCEILGQLYESHPGKNTKDCWNTGVSNKSSFLHNLTDGKCN